MNNPISDSAPLEGEGPWWRGLGARHWTVLLIAWMGWVFDIVDVYLLVLVKDKALKSLLPPSSTPDDIAWYSGLVLGLTLVGWSVGGLIFGVVADRWGRTRTMALTILIYSVFTGLAGLSQTWWQLFLFRFIASLGIGGEWAAGASIIAEVFPRRARAVGAGILQSASAAGFFLATFLAGWVGSWGGDDAWRYVFFFGAAPAFLALLVRLGLRESESWVAARARASSGEGPAVGSLGSLFSERELRRRLLLATSLASIGIFAYWGTTFWAPESLEKLLREKYAQEILADPLAGGKLVGADKLFGLQIMHVGILAGFLLYIPLTEWIGRRWAFACFHLGSLVCVPAAFLFSDSYTKWIVLFSVATGFSSGIFSGYTIYFPELFPTRVRATGAGFCYNVGRVLAAPGPILKGWLVGVFGSAALAGAWIGGIYVLALLIIPFLPETRGIRLDEPAEPVERG